MCVRVNSVYVRRVDNFDAVVFFSLSSGSMFISSIQLGGGHLMGFVWQHSKWLSSQFAYAYFLVNKIKLLYYHSESCDHKFARLYQKSA